MKSATRTVLSATLTAATSYSSGPLDVGDLFELAIDFTTTAVSGGGSWSFNLSRVGADGNLYFLAAVAGINGSGQQRSANLGAGLAPVPASGNNLPQSFGDQVQVDALSPNPGVATISTTISIKGK